MRTNSAIAQTETITEIERLEQIRVVNNKRLELMAIDDEDRFAALALQRSIEDDLVEHYVLRCIERLRTEREKYAPAPTQGWSLPPAIPPPRHSQSDVREAPMRQPLGNSVCTP